MKGFLSKVTAVLSAAVMSVTVLGGAFNVHAYDDYGLQEEETADVETDYSFGSTNSLGKIFSNEISEKNAAADISEEDSKLGVINKLIVSGKKAYVRYTAAIDSDLVVALYDENTGAMITSARTFASPETNVAELTFDVSTMPETFIVKAYLVDMFSAIPLSGVYTDDHYNSYWKGFYAKTTEDFPPELVLNLNGGNQYNFMVCDENAKQISQTNGGDQYNFMVYNENVKRISQTNGANQIISADDESLTYVIGNADSSITSLAEGEIFSLQSGNDFVIAKVKSITLDGTTATITSYEYDAADIFQFIKIDISKYDPEVQTASSYNANGVYSGIPMAYNGDGDNISISNDINFKPLIDDEIKIEKGIENSSSVVGESHNDAGGITRQDKVTVNCEASFDATLNYKMYYNLVFNLDILNIEESEISCMFNSDTTLTVNVSGSINVKIPIGEYNLLTSIPGLSFYFNPSVVINISTQINFTTNVRMVWGVKWSYTEGFSPVCYDDSDEDPVTLDFLGSILIGLEFTGGMCFINEQIASIGLNTLIGVEFTGERQIQLYGANHKHECKNCISVGVDLVITLQVELILLDKYIFFPKFPKEDKIEWIDNLKICLGPCEITLEEDEDANEGLPDEALRDYKLKLTLGLFEGYISNLDNYKLIEGECPHDTYKVSVFVKNKNGFAIPNAKVYNGYFNNQGYPVSVATYTPNKRGYFTTDNAGMFEVFLPEGWTYFWLPGTNGNIINECVPVNVTKTGTGVEMKNSASAAKNGSAVPYSYNANSAGSSEYQPILATIEKMTSSKIVDFDLGDYHSAAVTEDGSLYTWGNNYDGQLGNGTREISRTPIKVLDNVVSVNLGQFHSAAITTDGSLYMWGGNGDGQLGNGTEESSYTPIKILDNVASVSLGRVHSAAITTDGSLYMWGYNYDGQLGNGATESSYIPIKILDNVASVSLCDYHSAAITTDGSLYMWGSNSDGQLGNGTRESSYTPIKILDNVASVSLGYKHSAAITIDGSLYMWGENWDGQLGNGTLTDSHIPIKILDNVASVSLGREYSAAITTDGSLYMWGNNYSGQLGNGTTSNSYVPIKILDNVASVSLGRGHSAAITTDGSFYMWGNNYNGQLGNGTRRDSHVPTLVPFFSDLQTTNSATYSATATTTAAGTKTASFTGLTPGGVYNFYSVMYKEGRLTPGNLLYIEQKTADSLGNLTVSFIPRKDYADAVNYVAGVEKISLTEATISIPDITANGSEQSPNVTVTCRGVTLKQGRDFDLSGDFEVTDAGAYNLILMGKGAYTGVVKVPFNVVAGAVTPDPDHDPIEAFVERLYQNILNRPGDAHKADHIANLKNGKSACEVAFDFVFSDEFRDLPITNEERIKRMYVAFLDREADPNGLAAWKAILDNGCSIGHIFFGFTQSNEFTELSNEYGIVRGDWKVRETRDVSPKLTAFVSRLYIKALNRAYDVDGLNNHTANYLANGDLYQLAYNFIFSSEFLKRELSDEDFVDTMYRTFFDREGDPVGKADWLGKLKSGCSREEVLAGFVGSQECADLVAKFGI